MRLSYSAMGVTISGALTSLIRVVALSALLLTVASGQVAPMPDDPQDPPPPPPEVGGEVVSGQQQPEPVSPTNFPSIFTRMVGTDVWRSSVGGLRNVGGGTINVGGLGGTVTRAYLFWHGVTNVADPNANSNVQVNGFTLFGTPTGTSYDNGWGYLYSQAYRADVTGLVAGNPNKPYSLSGFGNGSFNPNGATLIIFYNDGNSANDYDVTIVTGNDSNGASNFDPSGWDVNFGLIYDYNVVGDSLELIVADGQSTYDPAMFINGASLRNDGPIFQGASVPSTNNGPLNNGNLWDMIGFNLDPYISVFPGYNNIRLTMNTPVYPSPNDYTSLVAAIVYVPIGQERVHITSPRVGGNLENTTQQALLGADVRLTAALYPDGLAGGNFSWGVNGGQIIGGSNSNTVTIRFPQTGVYTAGVSYTRNGVTISSSLNVNVIVPTLTALGGTQVRDQVNRDRNCSLLSNGATYSLGCYPGGPNEDGIIWSTTAQIPAVAYLSDPQQSGIKFVQAVSEFRKKLRNDGNFLCITARASENDVASGWQLDTRDPNNHAEHPPRRFSEGTTLTMQDFDAPATRLDGTPPGTVVEYDAAKVDDWFEVYVFYFTGDPGNPTFQVPLRLQSSTAPFSYIGWSWGGQVTFNSAYPPVNYNIQLSVTNPGPLSPRDGFIVKPVQSNAALNASAPCQGTTVVTNPIDGSRFFVRQQYIDILNRLPEQGGWDDWKTFINQCAFDTDCIHSHRITTARGFLESAESFSHDPALVNPGSHDYNREYVRLCYVDFLQRQPEQGGWDAWTNFLDTHPGDYDTLVHGFIDSWEYRNRFGTP